MNSKELIAAAEWLSDEAARYFETYMNEDHDDPDSRGMFERIDLVTDHILATVRSDDDEQISMPWLGSPSRACGKGAAMQERECEYCHGECGFTIGLPRFNWPGKWHRCDTCNGTGRVAVPQSVQGAERDTEGDKQ